MRMDINLATDVADTLLSFFSTPRVPFLVGSSRSDVPAHLPTIPTPLMSAYFAYIRSLVVRYLDEGYGIDWEDFGSLNLFGVGGGHKNLGYIHKHKENTQH